MKKTIEDWERKKIRRLTWELMGAAMAGMLSIFVISYFLKIMNWGDISSGIIFVPWMVVLILMIPKTYHQGVCDERKRTEKI